MRFQVLKAASMKVLVFSDVALCAIVDIDRRFRDDSCIHNQGDGDGCSKHLENVVHFLRY